MTHQLNLQNLTVLISKIPDSLLNKLKIECLNFSKKEKFISGLTSYGVTEHYYLEDNNIELFDSINNLVKTNYEKYDYLKSTPLIFQKPWFNIQKRGEFIPSHIHEGALSYSIWIQIPNFKVNNNKYAGCFEIQYQNILGGRCNHQIILDKNSEGQFVLFPSKLSHCVYPFEDTNEIRISVSGNILFNNEVKL